MTVTTSSEKVNAPLLAQQRWANCDLPKQGSNRSMTLSVTDRTNGGLWKKLF